MWRIAAAIVAMTGCYAPGFESCVESCTADTDCAPGHTCTTAGLCADADHVADCEAQPSPVGVYAMLFENTENGCAFPNWMVGAQSTIEVTISLHDSVVVAEPEGPTAAFLDAWLGSHTFAGAMTSNSGVALVLAGNKTATRGACIYTFDASFDATQSDNVLTGDVRYQARTNGAADCGVLTDCTTRQAVSGTRNAM